MVGRGRRHDGLRISEWRLVTVMVESIKPEDGRGVKDHRGMRQASEVLSSVTGQQQPSSASFVKTMFLSGDAELPARTTTSETAASEVSRHRPGKITVGRGRWGLAAAAGPASAEVSGRPGNPAEPDDGRKRRVDEMVPMPCQADLCGGQVRTRIADRSILSTVGHRQAEAHRVIGGAAPVAYPRCRSTPGKMPPRRS